MKFNLSKVTLSLVAAAAIFAGTTNGQSGQTSKSDIAPHGILKLRHVTILVRDYDDALKWYTEKLGFEKVQDFSYNQGKERFLSVALKGQQDIPIVLAKPGMGYTTEETKPWADRVGKTILWVFQTDDCQKMYETLKGRGVKFLELPKDNPWGMQAIFEDLYGNHFVLVGPRAKKN